MAALITYTRRGSNTDHGTVWEQGAADVASMWKKGVTTEQRKRPPNMENEMKLRRVWSVRIRREPILRGWWIMLQNLWT